MLGAVDLPAELLTSLISDLPVPCVVVDEKTQTHVHNLAFLSLFRCDTLAKTVHAESWLALLRDLINEDTKITILSHNNGLRLTWTITRVPTQDRLRILTAHHLSPETLSNSPQIKSINHLPDQEPTSPERRAKWRDDSPEADVLRQHVTLILEQAPVGISVAKLNGSVIWTNESWRSMWKLSEEDDPNTYRHQLDPSYAKLHVSRLHELHKAIEEQKPIFDFQFPTKTGTRFACSIIPLKENDQAIGFLGITNDVTESVKLQEQAFQMTKERDRQALDIADLTALSNVGLVVFNKEGDFQYANDATLAILELGTEEFWSTDSHQSGMEKAAASWNRNILPQYKPILDAAWKRCFETGINETHHCRLTSGRVLLVTFMWRGGKESGRMMSTITDITQIDKARVQIIQVVQEREAMAAKAAEAAEQATREAVAAKKEHELLVNVISHEIRSPISAIFQNTETVRDSLARMSADLGQIPDPDSRIKQALERADQDIECLDSVLSCVRAQERVSNDVLGLGSITANKYAIAAIPYNLVEGMPKLLKPFRIECRTLHISLELEISDEIKMHPVYDIDPQRVSQIITNLIANALRFFPTAHESKVKGLERSVVCTVERADRLPPTSPVSPPMTNGKHVNQAGSYLRFQVRDTGVGMSQDETKKLFKLFSQSSEFTHSKSGGTGLGLWISKRLCELQGGQIDIAASEKGKGSTFEFYIAAAKSNEVLESERSTPVREEAERRHLRVLFVDDNSINRTIMSRQLTEAGHFVSLASDGNEALVKIKNATVDAVIMDFEMPMMDGIQTTKALKAIDGGRYASIPILGCSASIARVQEAKAAGMIEVLSKPYKIREVLDALDTITSR